MPLDMQQTRLADLASWSGITPVPNEVLEAHKIAEVAKHPGSWLYEHLALASIFYPVGALVSIMSTISCLFLTLIYLASGHLWIALGWGMASGGFLTAGILLVSTGIFSRDGKRIYGPAEWHEYTYRQVPIFVPRPIREMANKIVRNGTSDLAIVYGKLVQNHVTIDPYLVIRRSGDQIVLGIWDDDQIIHQATLTE